MHTLRIAMAQLNFLLGDIQGNTEKIIHVAKKARDDLQANLIVFPELSLTAYPPEDLLLRPELHQRVREALMHLQKEINDIAVIVGHPDETKQGLYNAASVIENGKTIATYYKQHLPNYSVFDEKRYFIEGDNACVVTIKGVPLGITICEDLWEKGAMQQAVDEGAKCMINLNASPFRSDKHSVRENIMASRIKEEGGIPLVYVNLVGGQDELVFDGGSMVLDEKGKVKVSVPQFVEDVSVVELECEKTCHIQSESIANPLGEEETLYEALVLGVKDYITKNNFPGVLIGLSGGIDSALTLAIAVDALGSERVQAVLMPSQFTADISNDDAIALADALGVTYSTISIENCFETFKKSLDNEFKGTHEDVTEENIQARCRGVMLMALSNKFGKLVLTTGNKSEMAVGYATLYGDMAGGFAVLKDVPKTMVYQLAEFRNTRSAVIPTRTITRAPSAELRFEQTDQDSLPAYDILDPIMKLYVEENQSCAEIVKAGFERVAVEHIISLIDKNEYKRRQAPPGVRVSHRAFGRDWRYPITSGFYK